MSIYILFLQAPIILFQICEYFEYIKRCNNITYNSINNKNIFRFLSNQNVKYLQLLGVAINNLTKWINNVVEQY